ncbi:MAG: CDP-alcohol phosphatidyltransferase family protein [Acidimicrobiales bacterium]|nr:MAG: CDP-alcohol phosphatidyltransferase family protein [Acidimicrobiales bacterium]
MSEPAATSETASSMFDGVWTVPNLLTLLRLLCLPVFLYVLFGLDNQVAAALILGALSATDWVDGYLARRLGQVSEFGKVFDPTVDRLLFIVAITAIIIDGAIPLWFALAVLAREVLVGLMMAIATVVYKMPRFDVNYLGKVATALLMFAVPGFLIGSSGESYADFFQVVAWILGIPGLILSYWTGIAYIPQVRRSIAAGGSARSEAVAADT